MRNTSSLVLSLLLGVATYGCSHAVAGIGSDPSGGAPTPPSQAAAAAAIAPAAASVAAKDIYRVPLDGLPSIGNPNALVTIVAFTDYQCPYCQRTEDTLKRLRSAYGDDLRIVVAERPLPMHDRARPAAVAALAAAAQGKFAEMHARLFAQAGELDEASILAAARASGLDLARFQADQNTGPLELSEKLADQFGVRGTPTFFVGGRRVVGAQPYEVFRDTIDERLAAARALVAKGVARSDVYANLVATGADHASGVEKGDAAGCGGDCAGNDGDCKGDCQGDCQGKDDGPPETSDVVEQGPTVGAPARGPKTASITIVAFGDFECPFCAKAESVLHALESAHPGDVRIVFKNLPLPFHVHARFAAKAAIAADAQGHFWEFHDRLYAHIGKSIDRAALEQMAGDLGLDVPRFSRDMDAPAAEARIQADKADADALKIEGTPTFFVNGRRVIGAQPQRVFEAAITRSTTK